MSPIAIGDYSSSIRQEFRASDVRCSEITAPSLGDRVSGTAVTITFVLKSDVDVDLIGSVIIEYSTAGVGGPWTAATTAGATTSLAVSAAGTSHSVTWDTVTDIGSNVDQDNVMVRVTADDGTNNDGDADTPTSSNFFTVDNLPLAPVISAPLTNLFRKDKDYPSISVEFDVPTDPGSDKLWPVIEMDKNSSFTGVSFSQVDSNTGMNYLFFDVKIAATLKPIPGYYVSDVSVNVDGTTTVTFNGLVDAYTAAAVPTTIGDARVLIVSTTDRRVYLESVSNTQVVLRASAAGATSSPKVDLFIFSDVTTDFYVVEGFDVSAETATAIDFNTMTEAFLQSIPNPFGTAPRVLVIDESDRPVITGTITTTSIELHKSAAGSDADGKVTLFILKTNADIYQDDDVSITNASLTVTRYDSLTDGASLPATVGAAIPHANLKSDRHVYLDIPTLEDVQIAKSAAGVVDDATADINIFTEVVGASAIWVVMPSTGISDTFEGDTARYRLQSGDVDNNIWYFRTAFGNL